jgi:biopolymer transport protein ExbD
MRFSRVHRRTEIKKGQLDIAPLIDVVFQLLIFFMLTSNFVLQSGVSVRLPKAITSEVISTENLVLTVTAQDLIFLNDQPITVGELTGRLKAAAAQNKRLLLKADTGASVGRVVEIWDLCREVGIPQINIATSAKQAEGAS